jgi:hypothetical protein
VVAAVIEFLLQPCRLVQRCRGRPLGALATLGLCRDQRSGGIEIGGVGGARGRRRPIAPCLDERLFEPRAACDTAS